MSFALKKEIPPDDKMLLEDVEMEVRAMLSEIESGSLHWWTADAHENVQDCALNLMKAMAGLRDSQSAKPVTLKEAVEAAVNSEQFKTDSAAWRAKMNAHFRQQADAYALIDKSNWNGRVPGHEHSTLSVPL